jgi:hypothetical protein
MMGLGDAEAFHDQDGTLDQSPTPESHMGDVEASTSPDEEPSPAYVIALVEGARERWAEMGQEERARFVWHLQHLVAHLRTRAGRTTDPVQ